MKKKLFLIVLAAVMSIIGARAQYIQTIQLVQSDATVDATAEIVQVVGTSQVTLTLPAMPVTGRTLHIVNYSTEDLIITPAITISDGSTTSLLSSKHGEILAGLPHNAVTIYFNGVWRRLL